mmetsp:Transcript_44161/g.127751  ORF Transcript_44161/g.127751 Transcript_44161/m.127751 type:complete len:226 (+) Transcript_44161:888-1565(+)
MAAVLDVVTARPHPVEVVQLAQVERPVALQVLMEAGDEGLEGRHLLLGRGLVARHTDFLSVTAIVRASILCAASIVLRCVHAHFLPEPEHGTPRRTGAGRLLEAHEGQDHGHGELMAVRPCGGIGILEPGLDVLHHAVLAMKLLLDMFFQAWRIRREDLQPFPKIRMAQHENRRSKQNGAAVRTLPGLNRPGCRLDLDRLTWCEARRDEDVQLVTNQTEGATAHL